LTDKNTYRLKFEDLEGGFWKSNAIVVCILDFVKLNGSIIESIGARDYSALDKRVISLKKPGDIIAELFPNDPV
jgi:hypothetical protein